MVLLKLLLHWTFFKLRLSFHQPACFSHCETRLTRNQLILNACWQRSRIMKCAFKRRLWGLTAPHHRRACWEVGRRHCHLLHHHPVSPQEMHDISTKAQRVDGWSRCKKTRDIAAVVFAESRCSEVTRVPLQHRHVSS